MIPIMMRFFIAIICNYIPWGNEISRSFSERDFPWVFHDAPTLDVVADAAVYG